MNKFSIAAGFTTFVASFFLCVGSVSAHGSTWKRISAPQQATVIVNGVKREIYPGCAFEGDDYSFYFKKGKAIS